MFAVEASAVEFVVERRAYRRLWFERLRHRCKWPELVR